MVEDSYIEIENVNVRFKAFKEGEDPPIVLLHGMAFNADTWDKLGTLDFIKEIGFKFYAIDLPGFGKSTGKRLNRDKASDFLRKFMLNMGIVEPVLVGPSMGGGVALTYAIKYNALKGLILIAPAGLNDPFIVQNIEKINSPCLIFWGDKDRVFPVTQGYKLREKLKNSKLVICPGARHPCYLDKPKLFHSELKKFLQEIKS